MWNPRMCLFLRKDRKLRVLMTAEWCRDPGRVWEAFCMRGGKPVGREKRHNVRLLVSLNLCISALTSDTSSFDFMA